ncbi:MAG: hypothetical protein ABSF70_04775 [Terracidiphilus sp.]|jgi:hypothetical protein
MAPKSSSQIHAFEDTWEWNIDAQRAYEQIVEQGGRVADARRVFGNCVDRNFVDIPPIPQEDAEWMGHRGLE